MSCKCPPGHKTQNYVSQVSSMCPVPTLGIKAAGRFLFSLVNPFAAHFWYGGDRTTEGGRTNETANGTVPMVRWSGICGGLSGLRSHDDLHAAGVHRKTNPSPDLQAVRHGTGQQGGGYVKVSGRTEGLVNKTETHKALCASVFASVWEKGFKSPLRRLELGRFPTKHSRISRKSHQPDA